VDKSERVVRVLSWGGALIAYYPTTIGSFRLSRDPAHANALLRSPRCLLQRGHRILADFGTALISAYCRHK
jgi:hypothetical protein